MFDPKSPEAVLALTMVVVAAAFEKFPPLSSWLNKFMPWQKQAIMALIPLLLTAVVFVLACTVPDLGLECPEGGLAGVFRFLSSWVLAWLTGQGTHYGTKSK